MGAGSTNWMKHPIAISEKCSMAGTALCPLERRGTRHRHKSAIVAAKKGKKGGSSQKVSVIPKAGKRPPYSDTEVVMHNLLMVESYRRKLGKPIDIDGDLSQISRLLFEAPFAVLAHDAADEPRFNYANQAALDLFEGTWDEVIGMESRKSADPEAEAQEDRQKLLKDTEEKGCSTGFSVWRRSLKGNRFQMHDAELWNVEAPTGKRVGQAVLVSHWQLEDGTHCGPKAPIVEGDVSAAEEAAAQQAEVVRDLKDVQGLKNSAPEVQAAVDVLLERKAVVTRMRDAIDRAATFRPEPSSVPAENITYELEEIS